MAPKNRRLAGMRLAGRPDVDVTEQLRIAQDKLKKISAAEEQARQSGNFDSPSYPESLSHSFEVDGHRIELNANASRPYIGEINLEDGKQYFGNKRTFEELSRNIPEVEYGLTWSVDGSYDNQANIDPRTRLKIARQVQREWDTLIQKMPENSIVANSPVGASQGDYGRADLYMAAGFGPVQDGGSQYGIVHKGKIQPLSPQGVDQRHGQHLANRARMAGDIDLANAITEASQKHDALLRLPWDGPSQPASNAKGGRYDDYDDGYDDDYEPPASPQDLRRAAKGEGRYGVRDDRGLIPEIARREDVVSEMGYAGLDRGDRNARWPDRASTERADYANFEPTPEEIGEFRDLQVQLLNDPSYNAMRRVSDVFNRQFPRPLPQRLDGPPEPSYGNYRGRRGTSEVRSVAQLDDLPPEQRRAAAIELIRNEIDERTTRGMDFNEYPQKQASLKHAMVDTDELVSELLGNGALTQELYSDSDVAALRELQAAVGAAGGMRPDYEQISQTGVTNRSPVGGYRRRRRRRGGLEDLQMNEGRGFIGEVVDYPAGTVTTDRRILSPEQRSARQSIEQLNAVTNSMDTAGTPMDIDSSIAGINDWFTAQGRAGDWYRDVYGSNVQELTAGLQPSDSMSDRAVRQILHSATTQPGRFDREEVGRAYLTMLQRSQGSPSVNPDDLRRDAYMAQLAANDRGPMAPIRRNPMAPGQMVVDVPGVGPLRRPNPFVPEDTQLLPDYLQPRPSNLPPRAAQPQMSVAPQGSSGRLFDDFLDSQIAEPVIRPQASTPALERGPDSSIIAQRNRRLAEIRGEVPLYAENAVSRTRRGSRRPQQFEQIQADPTPVIPTAPPRPRFNGDGTINYSGVQLRDQLAHLDAVQRAVSGQPLRQPEARQLELSLPTSQRRDDFSDLPAGLTMNEFLAAERDRNNTLF